MTFKQREEYEDDIREVTMKSGTPTATQIAIQMATFEVLCDVRDLLATKENK